VQGHVDARHDRQAEADLDKVHGGFDVLNLVFAS
jgi:hypothetical protein